MGKIIALTLLRALGWCFALQPRVLRRLWSDLLGSMLFVFKIRAYVIRNNLERAYPTDEAERKRLFRAAYGHLGKISLEFLMVFGGLKRFVEREVIFEGTEIWRKARERGRGVIFVSSHVGNWEVMGAAGGLMGLKEVLFVTKHIKPEWLHQAIEKGRRSCNVRATYEPRTLKDILRELRAGRTVGLVLDQYMGPPIGVRVPFFGTPVGTSSAVATLAKRTGATVLTVVGFQGKDGKVRVVVREAVPWIDHEHPEVEICINTARYSEILERDVREHPDQWLWTHRRFKGDLTPLRPEEWQEGRARR